MSDITRTTEKTVVTVNVRRNKVVVTSYDHLTVEESKQLRKELKKAEVQAAENSSRYIDVDPSVLVGSFQFASE
ncbi:hypothetical protein ACSAGD_10515 [Paramicrobacterium sp. CJ85]|uniref:hypothetical protein n=1 Tax=Paramicrobacterium sp. CJ85 TaxID=3445355 RepID=UPI003F5F89C9